MFRFLIVLMCLAGVNAFAAPDASTLNDLRKVDQFGCNIEVRGENQLRILTTPLNTRTNRYLDLDLLDEEMKFEAKANNGWTMSKTVDLAKRALNPIFPKFLYGHEITQLEYSIDENGAAKLTVSFTASTMSFISTTHFECAESKGVVLDKKNVCPSCLSSK